MKTRQVVHCKACPECGEANLRRGRQCHGCNLETFKEDDCLKCEYDTELVDYCPRCDYLIVVGR